MILEAKNIWKTFQGASPVTVLKGINLTLEKGQSIAICGRSGEGKTTLLHILGLLEEPDQGTISIANKTDHPAHTLRGEHIGFIFQSYNLLEDFTVLENLLLPARIQRKKPDPAPALALLERLNLKNKALSSAKLLSGGEKQRVAIARALLHNPDLILADEPSGNLDRAQAEAVGRLLIELVREQHKSLILVTHDPKLAALCDRIYTLSDGHLALT